MAEPAPMTASGSTDASGTDRVRRLYDDALVADMVFVYEPDDGSDCEIFPRWIDAGFGLVSVHTAGDRHNVGDAVKRTARARRQIEGDARYLLVDTADDIDRARASGRLAVVLHLEGFRPLERELAMVGAYYRLGVRFCHPIFNLVNEIGGGCADREEVGLTSFGISVIGEMNRVGMIVDGSHASRRATLDMMEVSSQPVIFSHVGCDAIHPQLRNCTDEQIRRSAETGGIIGITSAGYYLGGMPTPETFFRHIDHVAQLVGPEHVGIGMDYCANTDWLRALMAGRPHEWPGLADGAWDPVAFLAPEQIFEVTEQMCRAGYSDDDVRGVLGENFLRTCRSVWK